ncbi:MAG: hypothetical protein HYU66_26655 [Armatimonadetes bacterium]|nr:hypothetical protein [Armatimonadota bacterium]
MVIGVPREIKDGENRVALTPAGASALTSHDHFVLVESGAGQASGFEDAEYTECGAEVVGTAAEVWGRAEMVVKVKEPLEPEWLRLRDDLILFTYLHLASSEPVTRALLDSGCTAVGYERMAEVVARGLP